MALTDVDIKRQSVLYAEKDFAYTDLTSATAANAIFLPPNARPLRGGVDIETAFNSSVSDAIDIGDTETPDPDRYTSSPLDAQSTGVTALNLPVANGKIGGNGAWLTVEWTGSGDAPSAGAGKVWVEYIIEGRKTEFEPYGA